MEKNNYLGLTPLGWGGVGGGIVGMPPTNNKRMTKEKNVFYGDYNNIVHLVV